MALTTTYKTTNCQQMPRISRAHQGFRKQFVKFTEKPIRRY